MFHDCVNKYTDNKAYSIYTKTATFHVSDKPQQTYDYLSATDNIKTIYVKYKDDKIICRIIGWNGKESILQFNRNEHVVIDYL